MSLVVWLPLNGNLNNQGLSDVSVTNNGATVDNNGKIGNCYACKSNGYIRFNVDFGVVDEFTICFWIKVPQTITSAAAWQQMLNFPSVNDTSNSTCSINWASYNQIKIFDDTNHQHAWITISYDTWIHYVITNKWDGTTNNVNIYQNGIKYGSYTASKALKIRGGSWVLGAGINATYGPIYYNDFRIYDHCLSEKEIKEISKGLVLHYKLDELSNNILPLGYQQLEYIESSGTSYFNTNLKFNPESDSFNIVFKGNDTANNGMIFASSGGSYFWLYYYSSNGIRIYADNRNGQQGIAGITSDLNKHIVEFKNKHYYIDNIDKGTLSNTYTSTTNYMWLFSYGGSGYPFKGRIYYLSVNISGENRVFVPAKRLSDSAVGMYEFITDTFYTSSNASFAAGPAINNTISIADVSGYGHDGTITGTILINNPSPRYSKCFLANTADTYSSIVAQDLKLPDGPTTLSFWSKPVVSAAEDTSKIDLSFSKIRYFTYLNYPYFIHDTNYHYKYTNFWSDGKWHYITCVYTGSALKLYIDSNLISMQTTTTTQNFNNNLNLQFRKNNLSDFRIYATALTADDILELYHTAASIDNNGNLFAYQLNEV